MRRKKYARDCAIASSQNGRTMWASAAAIGRGVKSTQLLLLFPALFAISSRWRCLRRVARASFSSWSTWRRTWKGASGVRSSTATFCRFRRTSTPTRRRTRTPSSPRRRLRRRNRLTMPSPQGATWTSSSPTLAKTTKSCCTRSLRYISSISLRSYHHRSTRLVSMPVPFHHVNVHFTRHYLPLV